MAQGPQQFSAVQILEAGRRAEIEGRVEYAIQFYRHLTDHLPRSPEAATAREALTKLGANAGTGETGYGPQPNGASVNGHYLNGAPSGPNGYASQSYPAASQPGGPMQGPSTRRPMQPQSPGTEVAIRPTFLLPKSRRRYRSGRVIARAFTFLGFLQIGVGIVGLIVGLLSAFGGGVATMPSLIASQPPLIAASGGITLCIIGLAQVLGGQLARAIFDTASANRDLAALGRAKAAFDAGIAMPIHSDH